MESNEKLKQEAEEYAEKHTTNYVMKAVMVEVYLASAEPREKRIAEAESLIKEIINTWENPRTDIPFRCAIKHAKEFIGWKE